jgi:hypothetical protein
MPRSVIPRPSTCTPASGRGAASLLHRNRDADCPNWTGRDLATRGYAALDLTYDRATTAGVLEQQ